MDDAPGTLSSGELARSCGISTDTLRHYERKGVLPEPERRANGYRRYPASALRRVQWIRAALGLGFTLDELAAAVDERDAGGVPCRRVRDLAAAKLATAEERLAELERRVTLLRRVLAGWDDRLSATPPGGRARLLDALVAETPDELPGDPRPRFTNHDP